MLKILTLAQKNRYFTLNLESSMQMSLKYSILVFVSVIAYDVEAQTSPNNQAIVTIIGDPVQSDNPYVDNSRPPARQQVNPSNQTIDPTLENGFHMRFEVGADQYINHGGTTSYSYASSGVAGYGKTKKHVSTISERSFNVKKRFKSWMPERRKKYRPHLCGRF